MTGEIKHMEMFHMVPRSTQKNLVVLAIIYAHGVVVMIFKAFNHLYKVQTCSVKAMHYGSR
jgi:hypothetical protein